VQLIIPMSGMGKRFSSAGYAIPKPLIEVDGKPMIEHVVDLFPGVENVTFIINDLHSSTTDMNKILRRIKPSCKIFEVPCGSKAGPVDVVSSIFDKIDDSDEVIVSYCDYGAVWDFNAFLENARQTSAAGSIACYRGFHPHMLGSDNYAFVREQDGVMLEIKEKEPFTDKRMNEYASNGTYYFRSGSILKKYFSKLLESGRTVNGEYYVSLVYNLLVQDSLRVNVFEISKMLQWGTPYDLEIYNGWSKYFNKRLERRKSAINPAGTTTLIPAAGRGSRFADVGYENPKPLLDVDGKPMIVSAANCLPISDHMVFACLDEHIDKFRIDSVLQESFDNCEVVNISEVTQGQACTCEIAADRSSIDLEAPLMISACDNGVVYDAERYQNLLDDESNDVIVWSFRNNQASKSNPNAYAWLDVDQYDNIKHVSCKKFIYDDPLKTHAIIGTMFFRKAKYFLDGLKKNISENVTTNGEFYVDDVINQNVKSGLRVKVFESDHYICWGTPDDYMTFQYWKEHFKVSK